MKDPYNMLLLTNASGTPQLSYGMDKATSGIVDVYNPGNMVNIIAIGGKQGNFTFPGFGDDWIEVPTYPGQIAIIGDNGQAGSGLAVDITN